MVAVLSVDTEQVRQMILTDGIHLVSDSSLEELHAFAQNMGLKRHWFQVHRNHPHYDLTTNSALTRALARGAYNVSSKELIRRMVRR